MNVHDVGNSLPVETALTYKKTWTFSKTATITPNLTSYVETAFYNKLLKERIKAQIEVTRRRGRRRKKLLDDLKDRRGYCQLKEEALDRTMWRSRFRRGFGPVVWQITYDDDDDDDTYILCAKYCFWVRDQDMFHWGEDLRLCMMDNFNRINADMWKIISARTRGNTPEQNRWHFVCALMWKYNANCVHIGLYRRIVG